MKAQQSGDPKKARKAKANVLAMTEKEQAQHTAKITLSPSVSAAAVIGEYGKIYGKQDVSLLVTELRASMGTVQAGNLKHCEAMLLGQAEALQTIFVNLARRAVNQDYLSQYETYLRLALKAQNQSRMTLETLATIKNPPVVFAKQANINQGGNQQVNNGTPAHTHAGENKNTPNELLEVQHGGETLDSNATGAASGVNQKLEAVGAIHRG